MRCASGTSPRKYTAIKARAATCVAGRCVIAFAAATTAATTPSISVHGSFAGAGAGQVKSAVFATRR